MTSASQATLGRGPAAGFLVIMGACWGLQFAMLKLAAAAGYSELAVLVLAHVHVAAAVIRLREFALFVDAFRRRCVELLHSSLDLDEVAFDIAHDGFDSSRSVGKN